MRPRNWIPMTLLVLPLALACEKKAESVCPNGADVTIAGNHGHAAELPADKLVKGRSAQAALRGGTHEHALVLKADQVEALGRGEKVQSRTSSVNAHVHEIEVSCKP
ncbi:MAG TPA: hypothetical protein PKA88_02215 [Polyangiaceae bacterium]|nr:hypothetical protein [Polyangiaceae bacterium]HMR75812.1 hypothetical protein [Polyangiaceae bacterium]